MQLKKQQQIQEVVLCFHNQIIQLKQNNRMIEKEKKI